MSTLISIKCNTVVVFKYKYAAKLLVSSGNLDFLNCLPKMFYSIDRTNRIGTIFISTLIK